MAAEIFRGDEVPQPTEKESADKTNASSDVSAGTGGKADSATAKVRKALHFQSRGVYLPFMLMVIFIFALPLLPRIKTLASTTS